MRKTENERAVGGVCRDRTMVPEDWGYMEHVTSALVDNAGFRELLRSLDPNRFATLIRVLGDPHCLNLLDRSVAARCISELNSLQKSVNWGKKVCLIDSDTRRVLDHCHVRATGHIRYLITRTGSGSVVGFGRKGIFVRREERVEIEGEEIILPMTAHEAEMMLIESDSDGSLSSQSHADNNIRFRSLAVEQTPIGRGCHRLRDLETGKTVTASIGYRLSDGQEPLFPRHLRIEEASATAADYAKTITNLREALEEAVWWGLKTPALWH
jgi:hypothetical protein